MPAGEDMANGVEEGREKRDPGSGVAGAREYASHSSGSRQLGAAFRAGVSGRMKSGRFSGSLAARMAIMAAAILAVAGLFLLLAVQGRIDDMRWSELRREAADAAFAAAFAGRLLIESRARFMRERPEYVSASEWKPAEHWLVMNRLVDVDVIAGAVGFEPGESAPIALLDGAAGAAILSDLVFRSDIGAGRADSALVAVFNSDGSPLASASGRDFPANPDLMAPLRQGEGEAAGSSRGLFFHLRQDADAGPFLVCATDIVSADEPKIIIGTALAALSARGMRDAEGQALFAIVTAALMLQAIAVSLACWLTLRRHGLTLKSMASNMRTIAENDVSQKIAPPDSEETRALALSLDLLADRLRSARAKESENARLFADLSAARNVQSSLLPANALTVPGLDIHSAYRPAREVGGDYYDLLPLDSRRTGLVVADVSGKSMPAALIMSTARAVFRAAAPDNLSAAGVLSRVNAMLAGDIPRGMFVTACYLIIDTGDHSLLYAAAGHTPLLIGRRDGRVEQAAPGGMALGFDSGPIFERSLREEKVELEAGDRILAYTDGVVECQNPAREEYSERRLCEFLRRNRSLSSRDFVDSLLADLDRHRGEADVRDDTTIVTFMAME